MAVVIINPWLRSIDTAASLRKNPENGGIPARAIIRNKKSRALDLVGVVNMIVFVTEDLFDSFRIIMRGITISE